MGRTPSWGSPPAWHRRLLPCHRRRHRAALLSSAHHASFCLLLFPVKAWENTLVKTIPALVSGELGRVPARDPAQTHQPEGQSGLGEGSFEDRRGHPDPRRGDRAKRGARGSDRGRERPLSQHAATVVTDGRNGQERARSPVNPRRLVRRST